MSKFMDAKNKAPAQTLKDKVDQMITWYEKFKPESGNVIRVDCLASDLKSFATFGTDGKYWYGGRELIPIKTPMPSVKQYQAEHQAKIQ